MTETKLCEPCRRLIVGDLPLCSSGRSYDVFSIQLYHHIGHDSYKEAMQLPCSLCNLAWLNAKFLPSESSRSKFTVRYSYDNIKKELSLFFAVFSDNRSIMSAVLFLEHLSTSTEFSISYARSLNTREALPFLLKQYHECRAHHAQCTTPELTELDQCPSRLLDVGHEGSPIILRNTKLSNNKEYVCLSHCWGHSKPYTLNSTTKQDLEKGIDAEKLPKTFQDAIHVTRCLCIRYLWIDSLCIIQDSQTDWATESGRMGNIYARASCTIAATASSDSDGGLFFDRHPQKSSPILLNISFDPDTPWLRYEHEVFHLMGTYLCDLKNITADCIERAPLNSRAWVSQERQLSCRTMHFSNRQLFWECHGNETCETYPNGIPEGARPGEGDHATMLKRRLHEFQQQQRQKGEAYSNSSELTQRLGSGLNDSLYRAWCSFRINYSRSALTLDSDKLVALRGIAKQIEDATGDELLAGLWRSRIIEELCWFKNLHSNETPSVEPTEWRAPTWSWAASNCQIWDSIFLRSHYGHKSGYFETKLVDLDIRTKPSGELTHASMRINCKPILVTLISEFPLLPSKYRHWGHLVLMEEDVQPSDTKFGGKNVEVQSEFYMDDPNFHEQQQAYIVAIQRCFHVRHIEDGAPSQKLHAGQIKDVDILGGLILQPQDKDLMTFSRIGIFDVRGTATVSIFNAHLKAQERVITLV